MALVGLASQGAGIRGQGDRQSGRPISGAAVSPRREHTPLERGGRIEAPPHDHQNGLIVTGRSSGIARRRTMTTPTALAGQELRLPIDRMAAAAGAARSTGTT